MPNMAPRTYQNNRAAGVTAAAVAVMLCSVTAIAPAFAQADFTGVWQAFAAMRPEGTGPGQALTAAGQARIDRWFAQFGDDYVEPGIFCVPPGMPATMTSMVSYPIEIIHSENRITILAELDMQIRRVFMDGRDFPADHPTARMGYSIGHWEDDTLIIETRLLSEYLMRNWPRTEDTHIIERVYRTTRDAAPPAQGYVQANDSNEILAFELTVVDDSLYAGPQQITMYYQRIPDDSFLEYDCPAELWYRALAGESF
jgi:hypothetical protein